MQSEKVFLRPRDRVRVAFHDGSVEFDTRVKGDWKPQHLWVPAMWFIIGLFSRELKKEWYSNFSMALGRTVYNPSAIVSLATLLHEARHVYQYEEGPLSYFVLYPAVRKCRLGFELDAIAYGQLACSPGMKSFIAAHWAGLLSSVRYAWAASESDAYAKIFALPIPPMAEIHTGLGDKKCH